MNETSYKIAIVSEDGTTVNGHFGSANFFEVFTVENGVVISREKRQKLNVHATEMHHLNHLIHNDEEQHQHTILQADDHSQTEHGHGEGHRHGNGQGNGHGHGHNHTGMIANVLDCKYLLSRGMGYGIYNHLENAGIIPIVTNIRGLEDAVKSVIDGSIVNYSNKLH